MTKASASVLFLTLVWSACVPDPGPRRGAPATDLVRVLVDAEDARPSAGDTLDLLLEAAASEDASHRRLSVRALGRLEDPTLSDAIGRLLADEGAEVRAAAAEALAQSVHGGDGGSVLDDLLARVGPETDPEARGALARSLGRLRLDAAGRRRAAEALVELAGDVSEAPDATLLGVALGFESLTRLSDGDGLSRSAADALTALMGLRSDTAPPPEGDDAGHIRALAASALGSARRLSSGLIDQGLDDPDPEVRRVVLRYLDAAPPSEREALLRRALADTSARVGVAAVRYLASRPRTPPRCDQLVSAAGPDGDAAVRITALEALSRACPDRGPQRSVLLAAATELQDEGVGWQPAAQGLLSLASVDPAATTPLLPRYAGHGSSFVRAWAARAAAAVRHRETLDALASDASPNVRLPALEGLFALDGHDVDDLLLAQLQADDPQLLIGVASLLEGAPDRARVARTLMDAFERISTARRETWRDPRVALLVRIAELGDESLAERLSPFLQDYDPLVAERVAALLTVWTGRAHAAEPQPLPRAPVPTSAELGALDGATLTLHMEGGDALVLELLAAQAPTNVARIARLAESGYYDGLTFHRWAPNFVIQGGSPGANEYQGDGPYTRDEVGGLPHWRGTVGLSTRGRDTGDAQIFINLADNPRLDHDYTVLGRLVAGHEVLDGILEGAVIERAVIERGGDVRGGGSR